jgi:hypothetical protein
VEEAVTANVMVLFQKNPKILRKNQQRNVRTSSPWVDIDIWNHLDPIKGVGIK